MYSGPSVVPYLLAPWKLLAKPFSRLDCAEVGPCEELPLVTGAVLPIGAVADDAEAGAEADADGARDVGECE